MATSCIAVLTCLLFVVGFSGAEDFTKCGTDRSVLLKALFTTEDNLYQMDRVFSPARKPSSRYIRVNYFFIDNSTGVKNENCNVSYIWALGGFLLIQPPSIFEFTSLLFSIPVNNLEALNITLPGECNVLVDVDENGTCTCGRREILDRLTQQVNKMVTCRGHAGDIS